MDVLINALVILGMLLIAFLLLVLLSIPLVALRNGLVNAIYAFFKFIMIPAIVLGRALFQTQEWLVSHLSDTLEGIRHKNDDYDEHEVWPGWLILWPLVYLCLLAALALGDYYLFVLRFAVLFQLATNEVITVDVWTGVIWVAMIALWGGVTFDLAGVMHEASPFHKFSPNTRHILFKFALGAMIMSLVAGALFWLWAQFLISGIDIPSLTWVFVVLFALLINSAIAMAGWAIFLSLGSLYALLLITTLLLCRIGLLVCYALVRIINALAGLITSVIDVPVHVGRMVWNWFCCFPLAARLNLQPLGLLKQHADIGRELTQTSAIQTIGDGVNEETTEDVEVLTMYPSVQSSRIVNMIGFGPLARNFLPTLWEAFERFRATQLVRTYGVVDLNRSQAVSFYEQSRYGVIPLVPPALEIGKKLDRLSDASDARKQVTDEVITALVEANLDQRDTQSHILWVQSLPGLDDTTEQTFRDLIRHRQPHQHLIMYSELPPADQYDDSLIVDYQRLMRLQKEDIIKAIFLLNKRSTYARLYGENEQHQAVSTTLVSMEIAHMQNEYNPTLPEIIHRMAKQAAFIGMAFSSKHFAGAGLLNTRRPHSMKQPEQFENKLADLIAQSKAATVDALTPEAQTIQASIDTNKPLFIVYTVPSDIRGGTSAWNDYTRSITRWLDLLYPEATPIFVKAAYVRANEGNVVRVAVLFPLPDILPSLRANISSTANSQTVTVQ
ncbi:MAG: hypothetical protein NVSMB49_26330 [Ktedonobacteraceae bacterium]